MKIACIVEGHGEEEAVPVLIRRIAGELGLAVEVGERIRAKRTQLLRPGELERRISLAAEKTGPGGAVFVLVDADDDPPSGLEQSLKRRAEADTRIAGGAAVAVREFEAWFIAGVEGLRGQRGIPHDLNSAPSPESIRGAKEWLSRFMPPAHPDAPILHQAAFTSRFDMVKARGRSPSFDRCYRERERLIRLT